MYSTKVNGNTGSEITNHSTHKANFDAAIKAKKQVPTTGSKK